MTKLVLIGVIGLIISLSSALTIGESPLGLIIVAIGGLMGGFSSGSLLFPSKFTKKYFNY